METGIKVARENFNSNPFLTTAALADIEATSEYVGSGYIGLKSAEVKGKQAPDIEKVVTYMEAQYVAAGVDLSHWAKPGTEGSCSCETH